MTTYYGKLNVDKMIKDARRCKIMSLTSLHRVTHITDFLAQPDPVQYTRTEL